MNQDAAPVAARPARDVAPGAGRLADHDTTYLLECLLAWRAVGGDTAANEIEAELAERGVVVREVWDG